MALYAVYDKSTRTTVGEIHPSKAAAETAIARLLEGLPAGLDGQAQRAQVDYVVVQVPKN